MLRRIIWRRRAGVAAIPGVHIGTVAVGDVRGAPFAVLVDVARRLVARRAVANGVRYRRVASLALCTVGR